MGFLACELAGLAQPEPVQRLAGAPPGPPGPPGIMAAAPTAAELLQPPVPTPLQPGAPAPQPQSQAPAQIQAPAAPAPAAAPAPVPPAPPPPALAPAAAVLLPLDFEDGVPAAPFGRLIYKVAGRYKVNPYLIAAVVQVESAFNPRARSRKGARGLMQLLPETARRFGLQRKKDLFNPAKNLEAGIRYLKWLSERFRGDAARVLAAYNAGEGAVERFGGVPPYQETRDYVTRIFGLLGLVPAPESAPALQDEGAVAAAGR